MWNHNRSNGNGSNQGHNNNPNSNAVPSPTTQDLQLFLRCLHEVAVTQISQWHDSLQAALSARDLSSGSSIRNNGSSNNNNNSQQQNNSAKTETSNKTTATKRNNREESSDSSSTSDSDSDSDSDSEDLIWVDGDMEFAVPKKQLKENGKPYFGWAFCHVNSYKAKTFKKDNLYCMGCMKCPMENCSFAARPMYPSKKKMGAPPKPTKIICPKHNCAPEWIPCTGNNPATTTTGEIMPCTLQNTIHHGNPQTVTAIHKGNHNHPRTPFTKHPLQQ